MMNRVLTEARLETARGILADARLQHDVENRLLILIASLVDPEDPTAVTVGVAYPDKDRTRVALVGVTATSIFRINTTIDTSFHASMSDRVKIADASIYPLADISRLELVSHHPRSNDGTFAVGEEWRIHLRSGDSFLVPPPSKHPQSTGSPSAVLAAARKWLGER